MSESNTNTLSSRREILFLYDIKMGNPNGDPDENRPRRLPDGTFYVTDVRLKRYVRDYFALKGKSILVGNIEGRTTNLTGRVAHHLTQKNLPQLQGKELVDVLLDDFIDARLFGSSFAFKAEAKQKQEGEGTEEVLENEESEELSEESSFSLNSEYEESEAPKESSKKSKKSKKSTEDKKGWQPKPEPKTLTGAVQFNMGEVKHKAQEIQIQGTSVFGSEEGKTQGTFTNYAALRYALIAFNGIANEHSAKLSRMSNNDFEFLLQALWNGVRSAANTRTKVGQVPRFLVTIEYKEGEEFQFGNLLDYIKLVATHTKSEEEWDSPKDYLLDLSCLLERLTQQKNRIESIRYECSPDLTFTVPALPKEWTSLGFDTVTS